VVSGSSSGAPAAVDVEHSRASAALFKIKPSFFLVYTEAAPGRVTRDGIQETRMAIGGLVLSLSTDPELRRAAERWIDQEPRLETGPQAGQRLAVVAATDTLGEGHDLCEALLGLPGVDNVEVAYVAPEEDRPGAETLRFRAEGVE
jgi:hypothetical protein